MSNDKKYDLFVNTIDKIFKQSVFSRHTMSKINKSHSWCFK